MNLTLQLPASLHLTPALFAQMQMNNKGINLRYEHATLTIEEEALQFSETDFLEIQFPFPLAYPQFEELYTSNSDWRKLEFHSDKIQINMAITGLIGAFSALVLVTLAVWNRSKKFGKVYNDPTAYELITSGGEKIHKIPDISLVAFHQNLQNLYNEKGFICAAPTLIIEIVSHKYSLQQDLDKMANHWMANITSIGVVVDPHRQKYHVFTMDTEKYISFSFDIPFKHPLLPELSIPFGDILNEARAES